MCSVTFAVCEGLTCYSCAWDSNGSGTEDCKTTNEDTPTKATVSASNVGCSYCKVRRTIFGWTHVAAENLRDAFLAMSLLWFGLLQIFCLYKLWLFDGFSCWYGWMFSNSSSNSHLRKSKNVLEKSFPQCLTASCRFEPTGHPHLWCGLNFGCDSVWNPVWFVVRQEYSTKDLWNNLKCLFQTEITNEVAYDSISRTCVASCSSGSYAPQSAFSTVVSKKVYFVCFFLRKLWEGMLRCSCWSHWPHWQFLTVFNIIFSGVLLFHRLM